jgi:protein-disulfide isomerase
MSSLRVPVTVRDHVLGSPNAELVLVEYGDYECPESAATHAAVGELREQFGSTLRYVYRHFPVSELHEHAVIAAEAAEAAAAQGHFWELHEVLFAQQHALAAEQLVRYAAWLGLDIARLRDDVERHAFMRRIRDDFTGGLRSGVTATPCVFVNGRRYDGARDATSLALALERAQRANAVHVPDTQH